MDEIVFLSTGDTCRSPMAEGLFRAMSGEQQTGLRAASAGVFTVDGLCASENAQIVAAELGADLSTHRSRVLTLEIVEQAKYLVCMTGVHMDRVLEAFPDVRKKLFSLLPQDVSDPFGGDLQTYRRAAAQIQQGIAAWMEKLTCR